MDALSSSIVNTAVNQASSQTADAVNVNVLKKALNTEAAGAISLLSTLPKPIQPPSAAPSQPGQTVGTRLDTYA